MKRALVGVIFACLLSGWANAEPWEEGVAAYKRGDYASALQLWKPLAEAGDPRAENNLGVIYENGLGVAQDDAEALKWYRRATAHGHGEARNNLTDLSAKGPNRNELALAGAERWVVIASRKDLDEAIDIARRYARHNSRVVKARNGWYAVVLGLHKTNDIASFRQGFEGPELPSDALLSRGTRYVETLWPTAATGATTKATTQDWVGLHPTRRRGPQH
jgi:hypothetical protein